jgi:hypothetical protein
MLVEFGPYLPDLPEYENPGTAEVVNAVPVGRHYQSLPGPQQVTDADLTERVQGAVSLRDADGTVFSFAGSASKLWQMDGADWEEVSRTSGGAYTTGIDERWQFAQFGRNALATNLIDPIQMFLMGTDTDFSALTGSPPKARYMDVVREFLVLGNTVDGVSGEVPHRVQWSPQGDPGASWASSSVTQADYQDLDATKGWIKQVVGGEYGVIFQERAITRMTYVGSPLVFQFDEVESDRGTHAPGSVVKVGNIIYYIGTDLRFYAFNGSQSTPVGANQVDQTFQNDVDREFLDRITAFEFPGLPIICFAYSGTRAGGSGQISDMLLFNRLTGNWGRVRFGFLQPYGSQFFDQLHVAYVPGYTLEQLDAISSSLDALGISLDSQAWTGGQRVIAAFSNGSTGSSPASLWYLNNAAHYTARLVTKRVQPYPGQRSVVLRYRPIVEGIRSGGEMDISTAILSHDTVWKNAEAVAGGGAPNSDGDVRTRSFSANYHQIRAQIAGGFTKAVGVDVLDVKPVGRA